MWWPLAASWLLMGMGVPMISAVLARLADPKIHLAAFGGLVFPVALIIEAPVLMLLSASTALSKDWASYQKIRRFMMGLGFGLTAVHFLLAFTPLYDLVLVRLMNPPAEIIEPARLGFRVMLPWTWSVAYRRFNQGVLIRAGRSKAISTGAILRLAANATTLIVGWLIGTIPGIVVGASGLIAGVLADAIYTGRIVQPILRDELRSSTVVMPTLTWSTLLNFYWPLAITSVLNLIVMPMGAAAIGRMPAALSSLAVWPVVTGFLFMWRSLGFAYNEVVVARMDETGSYLPLRRFTIGLVGFAIVGLAIVAATPMAQFWFETISNLHEPLTQMARTGLWVALLWPPITILRNTFQGVLVSGRKTKAVTESVIVFFAITGSLLLLSRNNGRFPGLYIALVIFQLGYASQTAWLWFRSRPYLSQLRQRDGVGRQGGQVMGSPVAPAVVSGSK